MAEFILDSDKRNNDEHIRKLVDSVEACEIFNGPIYIERISMSRSELETMRNGGNNG